MEGEAHLLGIISLVEEFIFEGEFWHAGGRSAIVFFICNQYHVGRVTYPLVKQAGEGRFQEAEDSKVHTYNCI